MGVCFRRPGIAAGRRPTLPAFYPPDHSVFFLTWRDGWSYPYDEGVRAECQDLKLTLERFFGMYDPRAAAGGRGYGQVLQDKRR